MVISRISAGTDGEAVMVSSFSSVATNSYPACCSLHVASYPVPDPNPS